MSALGQNVSCVLQFIQKLRGGSQPILAQASDGYLYVVKFSNNLQGQNLPFNESMGSELFRAFSLPVPMWKPLQVTEDFLDRNPDCWMETAEGRLRPAAGLCFGSRFLGAEETRLLEILPGSSFGRVQNRINFWMAWLIDICAEHTDNRQAIFMDDLRGALSAVFIDHGHMFSGPNGERHVNYRASRYLDGRIYPEISVKEKNMLLRAVGGLKSDQLWKQVQNLPADWKTASTLSNFSQCLDRLSNAKLLENIVDTMLSAYLKENKIEYSGIQCGIQHRSQVLCLGVQAP